MLSQHFSHNTDIHGARRQSERKSRGLHFSEHAAGHVPPLFGGGLVSAALKKLAHGFQQRQHKHMRVFLYALGVLDGILLKIRQPTVKEISQPTLYHCRKGFHAWNVQAICDTYKRYTYCVIDMPGSTHDSRAFANSSLAEVITRGCIPDQYYFLGDTAYKGTASILTPYIGNVRADLLSRDADNRSKPS